MAIAPETNEAFLREVDEELRRDQAAQLWRRWGRIAIGAIAVGLVALAAFLFWQSRERDARGVEGEQFAQSLQKLEAGDAAGAKPMLDTLAASDTKGYNATARLAQAAALLATNDDAGAAGLYAAIAADATLDQPFRDLALVRQTAVEYDKLTPAQVIDRLRPLAVPGGAFFGSAGEMTGIAYMRLGKPKVAGTMFAAMVADKQVPEGLRSRAVQLAAANGVDATQGPKVVMQ